MPSATFLRPAQRPAVTSSTPSGGTGLPAAPAAASAQVAAPSASADPSYLAYLRGAGVEESALNNVLGQRVGALTRQLGRELPWYAEKRERAVEGAGLAAENRGLYRSGVRMRNQFRAGSDVDRERMNFEAGIRDQIAELYAMNALDVAKVRQMLAEQGLLGSQNVDLANAEAGL